MGVGQSQCIRVASVDADESAHEEKTQSTSYSNAFHIVTSIYVVQIQKRFITNSPPGSILRRRPYFETPNFRIRVKYENVTILVFVLLFFLLNFIRVEAMTYTARDGELG